MMKYVLKRGGKMGGSFQVKNATTQTKLRHSQIGEWYNSGIGQFL